MYSVVLFYHLWCIFYEVLCYLMVFVMGQAASAAGATQHPRRPDKSILGKDINYTKIYDQTKL